MTVGAATIESEAAGFVPHPSAGVLFDGMVQLTTGGMADVGTTNEKEKTATPSSPGAHGGSPREVADASLWHRRVDAILRRDSPRAPLVQLGDHCPTTTRTTRPDPPSADEIPFPLPTAAVAAEADDATTGRAASDATKPRIRLRRHSMEGNLCPYAVLQLRRESASASPPSPPSNTAPPPATSASPGSAARRRRRSMEDHPPPFAALHLEKGSPRHDPAGEAAAARGLLLASLHNSHSQTGTKGNGGKGRPRRRHSIEAGPPVCPFKTTEPRVGAKEATAATTAPKKGMSGQTPPRRSTPHRRHSIDAPSSPFQEYKELKTSSEAGGSRDPPSDTSSNSSGVGPNNGAPRSGHGLQRRPRFVAPRIAPTDYGTMELTSLSSRSGSSKGMSSGNGNRSPTNAGHSKPTPRRRATVDCAPSHLASLRRPTHPSNEHRGTSQGHSHSDGDLTMDVDYSAWDAAMARYRRERMAQEEEAQADEVGHDAGGVARSGDTSTSTASVSQRGSGMQPRVHPRRGSGGTVSARRDSGTDGSLSGLSIGSAGHCSSMISSLSSVDSYVRKYQTLREKKRHDLRARLADEESVLVEADEEWEGSYFPTSFCRDHYIGRSGDGTGGTEGQYARKPTKSTTRTSPTEASSRSESCDFREEKRPIYVRTHGPDVVGPGALDVSDLSSSHRYPAIDGTIDQLTANPRGSIDVINERNTIRSSQRRASFTGLQDPRLLPDHDLGAERRGYEKRKSGEFQFDKPCDVDGGREVGRRTSFKCLQVPTLASDRDLSAERRGYERRKSGEFQCHEDDVDRGASPPEGAEDNTFLRQMLAEHEAFLSGVKGRYEGEGPGQAKAAATKDAPTSRSIESGSGGARPKRGSDGDGTSAERKPKEDYAAMLKSVWYRPRRRGSMN